MIRPEEQIATPHDHSHREKLRELGWAMALYTFLAVGSTIGAGIVVGESLLKLPATIKAAIQTKRATK